MKPAIQKEPQLKSQPENILTLGSSVYIVKLLEERELSILDEHQRRLSDIEYADSQHRRNLAHELGIIRQDIETLKSMSPKDKVHLSMKENGKIIMDNTRPASEPLKKILTQLYKWNNKEKEEKEKTLEKIPLQSETISRIINGLRGQIELLQGDYFTNLEKDNSYVLKTGEYKHIVSEIESISSEIDYLNNPESDKTVSHSSDNSLILDGVKETSEALSSFLRGIYSEAVSKEQEDKVVPLTPKKSGNKDISKGLQNTGTE